MDQHSRLSELPPAEFVQELNRTIKEHLGVDIIRLFESDTEQVCETAVNQLRDSALKRKQLPFSALESTSPPGDFDPVPNFLMTQQNADDYATLRGHEIQRQMQYVASCLTKLLEAKSLDEASYYLYASGFLALGNASALVYVSERQSTKSELAAISSALAWAPNSALTTAATIVVYVMRAYLALINDASIFGMVLNNTDEDLLIRDDIDVEVNTGKMTFFMHDQNDDNHPVAICGRKEWRLDKEQHTAVFAGFFFSEKREGALYGTDGAMILGNQAKTKQVAIEYSVPYSGENGCNIANAIAEEFETAKQAFRQMRPKQQSSVVQPPHTCAISDVHSQFAFLIASIG